MIILEELARVRADGFQVGLHSDIIAPYIHSFSTEEQKKNAGFPEAPRQTFINDLLADHLKGKDIVKKVNGGLRRWPIV